jgi:hypothetical protein
VTGGRPARRPRLTQRELRAINAALAELLAGELEPADGTQPEDYESAKAKIESRIDWRPEET